VSGGSTWPLGGNGVNAHMIPSGNLLQFAIEAMAIEIVTKFTHFFCMVIFHSYVSLPEGTFIKPDLKNETDM
jgi:hypothetical protein